MFPIKSFFKDGKATLKRFLLPFSIVLITSMTAFFLVDSNLSPDTKALLNKILYIGIGLFPISLAIHLFSEHQKWPKQKLVIASLLMLLAGVAYFFTIYDYQLFKYPLGLLLIVPGSSLLGMTLPFIKEKEEVRLWEFVKVLFLNFLVAASSGAVIFIGLTLALVAVDYLLFSLDSMVFIRLWIIVAGIYCPLTFLVGIPKNFTGLKLDYNKAIKVVFEYILTPLVFIYMAVLYLYLGKMIITWEWPKEGVVHYIVFFSIIGIADFFFLYPALPKNKMIQKLQKTFFYLQLPLLIVFFLGIVIRIQSYGFTVNRYIVFALGIWLAGITIFCIINNFKAIKYIPLSFSIIILLCSFGPWSAFSVSERSQMYRLGKLLNTENILLHGKVEKTNKNYNSNESSEISSIINYLTQYHGYKFFQPWFDEDLAKDIDKYSSPYEKGNVIMSKLGINKVEVENQYYFSQPDAKANGITISGYDYMIDYYHTSYDDSATTFKTDDQDFEVRFDTSSSNLTIATGKTLLYSVSLQDFMKTLIETHQFQKTNSFMPFDKMTFEKEFGTGKIMLVFSNISGKQESTRSTITSFDAYIAFTK